MKGAVQMPIAPGKKQLSAVVDEAVYDEVKAMADAMGTSTSRLLGMLITVAMHSTQGTIEAFASDIARLKGETDK